MATLDKRVVGIDKRDAKGRLVKGHSLGARSKGVLKGTGKRCTHESLLRKVTNEARKGIEGQIADQAPEFIAKLLQQAAEGDVAAANAVLKYIPPAKAESVVDNAHDLAQLPPDVRIREINARAAEGSLSLEQAKALTELARQEIEMSIIAPLKANLLMLKTGEKNIAEVLTHLAGLIDTQTAT